MGILEELRWTAMKLVNVGKFSVDSAVNESFKGGKLVYANVKEKLKGPPISPHSDGNKKQNYVAVEEMQATLEKMQEDMNIVKRSDRNKKQNYVAVEEMQAKLENMQEDENNIKQQNEIVHRAKQSEHVKHFPDDPLKSLVPEGVSAYQPPARGAAIYSGCCLAFLSLGTIKSSKKEHRQIISS